MSCCRELTLADALTDPITQALMAADGVDPRQLEIELRAVVRQRERQLPRVPSITSRSVARWL